MASPSIAQVGLIAGGPDAADLSIPVPAGVAADDIVVLILYIESDTAITLPAGFALLDMVENNSVGKDHRMHVAWKRATGADTGVYTIIHAVAWRQGIALRIAGAVTTGNPFVPTPVTGVTAAGATTTPPLALTTTSDDTLLLYIASGWDDGSYTAIPSWTEDFDSGAFGIYSLPVGAAGPSGTISTTHSVATAMSALLASVVTDALVTSTDHTYTVTRIISTHTG